MNSAELGASKWAACHGFKGGPGVELGEGLAQSLGSADPF